MRRQRDWFEELVHDLKTPLTAAKGFIDLVQNIDSLSPTQRQYVEKAIMRLDYMHSMINQLLELAPINKPLPVIDVDFDQLVIECVETASIFAATRGITLYVEMPLGAAGQVSAETNQLNKVLLNLLNNAIKYNIDGGSVFVQVVSAADYLEVSIADTGHGIAVEDQDRVWERLYRVERDHQSKIEGTGLGLSIVKAIVEKHGGQIGLISELNKGTTVTFTLPRRSSLLNHALAGDLAFDLPTLIDAESTDTSPDDAADAPLVQIPRAAYYDRDAPELAGERLDDVDDDLQEASQDDLSDADAIL
ncbi:MAG: HAMP domain-containing sensor histidine kinase [Chloroflexota bacterium]|nr:HAMP domain-containing sensor histidine kinase [Chloroflexota bacterium]